MADYFDNYWALKRLRDEAGSMVKKRFVKFHPLNDPDHPSAAHKLWLNYVMSANKVMDFGAGDLRFKEFVLRNGFKGRYRALDIGKDFKYDFAHLDETDEKFDLILCFEVIEHMELSKFMELLDKFRRRLTEGGKLIITTPNIHHVNHFWKGDVTHIRPYPYEDLYALLKGHGFKSAVMYRIVWWESESPAFYVKFNLRRILTHILGVDYANNIGFVASI